MKKNRKTILNLTVLLGLISAPITTLHAETFLSVDQAKQVLWQDSAMKKIPVALTKEQMKSIKKASDTRVRSNKINAWKISDGGWFIVDQVIGKHENIDFAVAINKAGKVTGVEILTYRETYGSQVRNTKWLAQFLGRGAEKVLIIDEDIKNISGATLSSVHVTKGVNRLIHTWDQVLKNL